MSSYLDTPIIVCDNGTGMVKVGYAGENFPTHEFPSIIGTPLMRQDEDFDIGIELKDVMVGDLAAKYRAMLETSYPVDNGKIVDWEGMKHLWNYTFDDKMGIDPKGHRVVLTEPAANPDENREKMFEAMLDGYGFQAAAIQLQAILVLCAQGAITGVVCDSGDGVTHAIPVFEGVCPKHLIRRLDVAGRHITQLLIKLLRIRGYAFNKSADFETVRQIKEKLCYSAYDVEVEKKLALETTVLIKEYELPDGKTIKLGRERYEAPEVLFNPGLLELESKGVHEMLFRMIAEDADIDLRPHFYKRIVLSGGSTMYPGMPTRLDKEIRQLYLNETLKGDASRIGKFKLNIESPPRRKNLVFMGASVLGDTMKNNEDFWITREQWEENGPSILKRTKL